jgi:hypothetical protein
LRYQAPKTQNAIYNSGFDIAQRGTSFTGLSGVDYTLDRWVSWAQTGGQSSYVSQQSVGNLSVTPNQAIRYCGRFGRTSGNTSTGARAVFQTLETADSIRFTGKTVTMSFYAKAGSGFTPTSGTITAYIVSGTGTDQIYYSFTGAVVVATSSVSTTTSWQRFSITGTVPTNSTQLAILFNWSPVGTAGANDFVELTGIQLEEGSVATPYNRMSGTIQGELAACQRYYWLMASGGTGVLGTGLMQSATRMHQPVIFPVTMRVAPSLVATSGTGYYNFQTSADDNFNSLTISTASTQSCLFFNNTEISGTAGQAGTTYTNNAASSVAFNAEL